MTDITEIVATIGTANTFAGGTNNGVYLGIAGREFNLDTAGSDFRAGATDTFVIGTGSNVSNASFNDPTSPQLTVADLDLFPVYIRLDGTDEWRLDEATVTVNGTHVFTNPNLAGGAANQQIWLAKEGGTVWHLRRTAGTPAPAPGSGTLGGHVVRGNVNADGSVQAGSGNFRVIRRGAGEFYIQFTTPFPEIPSATATIWGSNWWMEDTTHIAAIDQAGVTVYTSDNVYVHADRPFSFIVIG
ncbi:hypothetical protein GCM10023084_80590 [Streptomyces lacrimifluminis]|uniref:Uncharacterized protein n=1 Tax=Streptomyces lacrimifluminis TaxID=1500077 RepID=A0A917PCK3_9ACTN|nr:hypothetical protein [Streptomyces lacrimifluminis]GGJ70993.1 hypothetical protein GCM10012282_79810 [Streptomyces lacrimifluminis]